MLSGRLSGIVVASGAEGVIMDTSTLDKRAKEIEQEYLSSLADLNVNSKPLINMLTILAEENLEYAQIIVAAVEKHLAKVKSFMSILTILPLLPHFHTLLSSCDH